MKTELLPNTYHSADFDKTPPEPHVIIPDKLIHEGVESAGKQGGLFEERKHPVFFVDLPSKTISLTIGWLDPGQSSNMHRHTYETILYVLEGEGYSQVQDEKIPWKMGDALYIPGLGLAQAHQYRHGSRSLSCSVKTRPCSKNIGGIALRQEIGKHVIAKPQPQSKPEPEPVAAL